MDIKMLWNMQSTIRSYNIVYYAAYLLCCQRKPWIPNLPATIISSAGVTVCTTKPSFRVPIFGECHLLDRMWVLKKKKKTCELLLYYPWLFKLNPS